MKKLLSLVLTSFLIGCGGGGSQSAPQPVAPAPPPPPISQAQDPDLTQAKLLTDAELETPALSPVPSVNQSYADWLSNNHVPIRSVTYAEDFSDLEFLEAQIGDRSIVQLGESSHGTREFNQIKTRLIKYLHQNMDFDVIAFESGFFEGVFADSIRETGSPDSTMRFLFGVWYTNEVFDLFRYIQETQSTDRPLRIAGFDTQISSSYFTRVEEFIRDTPTSDQFDAALKQNLTNQLLEFRRQLLDYGNADCYSTSGVAATCMSIRNNLREIESNLQTSAAAINAIEAPSRREKIAAITILAAMGQIENLTHAVDGQDSNEIRDRNMAAIFGKVRTDLYPDEKIIIWAHNGHIAHRQSPINGFTNGPIVPMGYYLKQTYPDDLFSIGLYMVKGVTANNDRSSLDVTAPRPNSLEALSHSVRKAAFYLDVRPNQTQVEGNAFLFEYLETNIWGGSFGTYEMVPSDEYDGIIMIDKSSLPAYR